MPPFNRSSLSGNNLLQFHEQQSLWDLKLFDSAAISLADFMAGRGAYFSQGGAGQLLCTGTIICFICNKVWVDDIYQSVWARLSGSRVLQENDTLTASIGWIPWMTAESNRGKLCVGMVEQEIIHLNWLHNNNDLQLQKECLSFNYFKVNVGP